MSGEGSTSDRVAVESNVRCSFCSKRRADVGLLIGAQPSECFICNECVDLCNEIVEEELEEELVEVEPSRRPGPSGATTAPIAEGPRYRGAVGPAPARRPYRSSAAPHHLLRRPGHGRCR
jgi:ClpX C4-type zinc finger